MSDTELDDLDGLLIDPGWKLFAAYAEQQWGDTAVVKRMENAVGATLGNEDEAREHTQAILAAKRHIRALLEWPGRRVKELKDKAERAEREPHTPGRRPFSRTRTRKQEPAA